MTEEKSRGNPDINLDVKNARVAIIASRFNSFIVDRLVDGAQKALREYEVAENNIAVMHVPGALELPLAMRELAEQGGHDGVVALGAVIRGETAHFDYVCSGATEGLMRVSLDYALPLGFGLLTVDNEAQALARAGDDDNKGRDAALTVLEMISLLRGIRQ